VGVSGVIWVNGSFVSREEARVSALDAGIQHGVGLFETILAIGDEPLWLGRHIDRLRASARDLGLSESLKGGPLGDAVRHVVQKAGLPRTRIRLTVTGGDLNLLASTGKGPVDPTVIVEARPATQYPPEMLEKGVSAVVADGRLNPLSPFEGHKTLNYWFRLRALQIASGRGAGEAIFLQVTNHLAGGSVSNLFVVKDGALHAPIARGEEESGAIASPILPGITRRAVIEWAAEQGVGVSTRLLAIDDLLDADEAFVTNSSWGALPIVQVEAKPLADGKPGEITRKMRTKWEETLANPQSA